MKPFSHKFSDKSIMSVDIDEGVFTISFIKDVSFVELNIDDIYTILAVDEEQRNYKDTLYILNETAGKNK